MRADVPELLFSSREDFRAWLQENSETSDGVWLMFSKMRTLITLTANGALEEALCFGWIDGQMKSVDETKYRKYFARRRAKSVWSEKNRKIVAVLREKGMMTPLGEKAVETAKKNGTWDTREDNILSDDAVRFFEEQISEDSLAYENYLKMSPSVRRTYVRRYYSFKTEEARQRDFEKIIVRLRDNLKPM